MPHGLEFTDEEYATTLKVLQAVNAATSKQFNDPTLKQLRSQTLALAKIAAAKMPPHVKSLYGLVNLTQEDVETHRAEKWRKIQKQRDMDMDKKHTNARALRAGRLEVLQRLEKQQRDVPMIPDGVGVEGGFINGAVTEEKTTTSTKVLESVVGSL